LVTGSSLKGASLSRTQKHVVGNMPAHTLTR
jgi:hypothetical protein